MPLPALLLSRLKKRGIVKTEPEVEEEIIAEDYDDKEKRDDNDNSASNTVVDSSQDVVPEEIIEPVSGCPNKWNIYHDCTSFCMKLYGKRVKKSSPKTERKRLKMLKKYPLPENWKEIFDPGTGRYYYWFSITNEVSWLPPTHPRSQISIPANQLRKLVRDSMFITMDEENEPSGSEDDDDSNEEEEILKDNIKPSKRTRHRNDRRRVQNRGKVRENDLDPMDPAAYSEAPRGTWSSGLDKKGEAKTGADTTASGPLYQMRPYPSPGAVLRLNAELKKSESEESEED